MAADVAAAVAALEEFDVVYETNPMGSTTSGPPGRRPARRSNTSNGTSAGRPAATADARSARSVAPPVGKRIGVL